MKTCPNPNCDKIAPTKFHRNSKSKTGLQSWCKRCCNVLRRARYAANRVEELLNVKKRRKANPLEWKSQRLKYSFGISLEDYNNILKNQDNKCAICRISANKCPKGLYVDHCHKTGQIRGLLCNNCNTGIGMLQDSSELCDTASRYLSKVV